MYKKRWYDGLHDIYEGKDEFEIKFGCFGGDGGGGGSANTSNAKGESDTTPSTGFRGEQTSGTGTSATGTSGSTGTTGSGFSGPTGAGIGPGETSTSASGFSGPTGAGIGPGEQSVSAPTTSPVDMGMSMLDVVQQQQTPQNVSLVSNVPSEQSFTDIYGLAPISETPVTAQDVKAQDTKTPGLGLDVFGGKLSVSQFDPTQQSYGLTFSKTFARGGPVQQGIGSIFPYPRRR